MSKYKKFDSDPWWTTQVRKRYGDLLVGVDNSVWMYRRVPLGPVSDAVSGTKMLQVGEAIDEATIELSGLAGRIRAKRRTFDKAAYREFHLLGVNVPRLFLPPDIENQGYLRALYPNRLTRHRLLMFGVKLRPTTGSSGGLDAFMESVRHTLLVGGTPMSDYESDRKAVDAALARAGLRQPLSEEVSLANSWWNNGGHADIPYMPHGDHLHMFNTEAAARTAFRMSEKTDSCFEWPNIADEHALSFSTVESFDIGENMRYLRATNPEVHWAASLLDSGAVAISVRGLIEPSNITREELRRHKRNYMEDIRERQANNKMSRAEQEEMFSRLSDVEAHYSGGGVAPPTITDMSVTVAMSGRDERTGYDPTDMGERAGLHMDAMLNRQEQAFIDTMLCSGVRANPHLHDMPSTLLAYSGLPDLSVAGDSPREDGAVALLGFSESDQQPMWLDAMAATDEDSVPVFLGVGQSGSGKSVFMQWLADQYSRTHNDAGEQTPVIMLDLKELALDMNTRIPMADGSWSTMGALQVGDQVLAGDGSPCTVTHKSRVWKAAETTMYRVQQADGRYLDATAEHKWLASDGSGWRVVRTSEMTEGSWSIPTAVDYTPTPVTITPIGSVDSQCIAVDSADHTYLAGECMVTHNSDFTPSVEATGGTSYTLSDLIGSDSKDGIFDAIKFSHTPQAGVDREHSLLMQANPFGTKKTDYETPLRQALSHGVDNGATCAGQALEIAARDHVNDEIDDILMRVKAAATSPIFRAIVGFNPDSPGLRVSGGTTYIRIGDMSIDLPSPGSAASEQTQMQRTWLALIKAMVYGSISALANRQGVVMFDEGWIFLSSGRSEMEAMGRLARSQQVFPVILTQRTQDALRAELEGYISRGIILPIEDEKEAAAALKLFKLEQTPERMSRITAKATRGDAGAEKGAPNWNSLRALRSGGKVLRGTVGIYVDLAGNAVPTEIALTPEFLRRASTNRKDIAERQ